ncbi:MAG: 23S rRNA (guanosine(2251)-2'-O)-methyltransferase RlmB [Bacteroidota bacterium]|nr:23S rRNA (guanosine(2251)-2'-O)-methyltransferase RlmB [Bacteroidota bacterium]
MEKSEMIFGIRAVIEAVEAGKEIDKILVKRELQGDLSKELFGVLRGKNIMVQRVPGDKLNRMSQKNHQGVIAFLSAITYDKLESMVPFLYEQGKDPFVLVLDGLTDVRNFGAIARTCECAGVDAIVIPQRGSVTVSADAVKTSAGALLHIPVCREKSAGEALQYLKDCGFKLIAVSEKGTMNYTQADYASGPVALVVGSEESGIPREHIAMCDEMVSIPQFGTIASLNVSVATGVLIYEVIRQRGAF